MKTVFKKTATFVPLLSALLLTMAPLGLAAQSGGGPVPSSDFLLQQGIYAEADTDTGDTVSQAEFYVQARLPQNQREDSIVSYFDMVVEPGASQTLEVVVYNNSGETIVVDVAANSASTNRNGVIDYATPDVRDITLRAPFSDMASVREDTLTIPAYSSAVAQVDLEIPETPFTGNVLGGIVLTKRLPDASAGEDASNNVGASVQNRYRYVIGVLLTEEETYSQPATLELLRVYPTVINTRGALVHNLRNEQPVIIKNMEVSVRLFREGANDPLQTYTLELADMAPNSVLPVTMFLEETLQPGTYVTYVQARLPSGVTWRFARTFEITGAEAGEINETLPAQPINWLLILIIVVAVLLLLILILLVLLLRRRRTRNKTESANKTKK